MMLEKILEKCLRETERLTDEEILFLLKTDDFQQKEKIYVAARRLRYKYFSNKVFLYGFVYFSTYCHNECAFCYYRMKNDSPPRYRKRLEEIVETAVELQRSGVHLIDLTMGEDKYFTVDKLCEIVRKVKEETDLPIMISPGLIDDHGIERLKEAGASWYALYQETHNKGLFHKMRLDQDYDARIAAKRKASACGMLIEEGLLTGIGDTLSDAVDSFRMMEELEAKQVRTMTFIPQQGTPLADLERISYEREIMNIAVMRLLFPKALIPASLDVDGLQGLASRLMAGANVVTSIIPPKKGFAGVAKATGDIDEGYRTVEGIQETLCNCGLYSATAEEYKLFLDKIK